MYYIPLVPLKDTTSCIELASGRQSTLDYKLDNIVSFQPLLILRAPNAYSMRVITSIEFVSWPLHI